MTIRNYLTGTLGLTHLFMCDDATRDAGSNGIVTSATATNGSFVADPVCLGVTNSWQSNAGGDGGATGLVIGNTSDINVGSDIWREYSILIWFKTPLIDAPTCVYEQGGGTNNMAINVGLARAITSQAADAGQTFLVAQSNFLAETDRPYFVMHTWQHNSVLPGTLNKINLVINGVLQQEVEGATSVFPSHTGDATIGNANDALRSYNSSTQNYAAREKNCNMLGLLAGTALSVADAREIFERSTLAEVTIAADTVENQQLALDALIGNMYAGLNCAIRIVQATDATDYRLFVDNIQFVEDPNLKDIAIQYVGPNTLTIENVNGSNVVEVSTPAEVDLDGVTVLAGGGSMTVLTDNRIRLNSVADQTNLIADKLIIEQAGDYVLNNCFITEVENVSGGVVNITTDNPVATTVNTGAGSVTTYIDSLLSFDDIDTWELYATEADMNAGANVVDSGTAADVHRFTYSGGTDIKYLRLVKSGATFLQSESITSSGEKVVSLSLAALLISLTGKVDLLELQHQQMNTGISNSSLIVPYTDDLPTL